MRFATVLLALAVSVSAMPTVIFAVLKVEIPLLILGNLGGAPWL